LKAGSAGICDPGLPDQPLERESHERDALVRRSISSLEENADRAVWQHHEARVVNRIRLACAGGSISARSGTAADSVRPPSSLRAIILKLSGFGG